MPPLQPVPGGHGPSNFHPLAPVDDNEPPVIRSQDGHFVVLPDLDEMFEEMAVPRRFYYYESAAPLGMFEEPRRARLIPPPGATSLSSDVDKSDSWTSSLSRQSQEERRAKTQQCEEERASASSRASSSSFFDAIKGTLGFKTAKKSDKKGSASSRSKSSPASGALPRMTSLEEDCHKTSPARGGKGEKANPSRLHMYGSEENSKSTTSTDKISWAKLSWTEDDEDVHSERNVHSQQASTSGADAGTSSEKSGALECTPARRSSTRTRSWKAGACFSSEKSLRTPSPKAPCFASEGSQRAAPNLKVSHTASDGSTSANSLGVSRFASEISQRSSSSKADDVKVESPTSERITGSTMAETVKEFSESMESMAALKAETAKEVSESMESIAALKTSISTLPELPRKDLQKLDAPVMAHILDLQNIITEKDQELERLRAEISAKARQGRISSGGSSGSGSKSSSGSKVVRSLRKMIGG